MGDLNAQGLDALKQSTPGVMTGVCGMSKRGDIEKMVPGVVETLGGLDVLVNNAGISVPAAVDQVDPNEWEQVMQVEFTGT